MITKKELLNNGMKSEKMIVEQKTKKDFSEMASIILHSRTQTHTLH